MNSYIYPQYPLQRRDELLSQISSIPRHQQDMFHEDLPGCDPPIKSQGSNSSSEHPANNAKKIVHRDVERQRRQEMNSLYTTLRSLLPLGYVKGKRSISDHMNEATKYIRHLEENIHALKLKRDKLKTFTTDMETEGLCGSHFATVRQCWPGVEIVISCNLKDEVVVVSLSKVLAVLVEEGLNTLGCASTQVNGRLIYTVQAEVRNPAGSYDASYLQQKLMNLVRLQPTT